MMLIMMNPIFKYVTIMHYCYTLTLVCVLHYAVPLITIHSPKIHYMFKVSNFTDIDRITAVTLTLLVRTPQDLSLALVTKDFRASIICLIRE